jgi:hypothetical protein
MVFLGAEQHCNKYIVSCYPLTKKLGKILEAILKFSMKTDIPVARDNNKQVMTSYANNI